MKPYGNLYGLPVFLEASPRRKRTITIYVQVERILVRTPVKTSLTTVAGLLESRTNWIEEQVRRLQQERSEQPSWPISSLLLHGVPHPVHYRQKATGLIAIEVMNEAIYIDSALFPDSPAVKGALIDWLRTLAREELKRRVEWWSEKLNCTVQTVRVKDLRSRWGSCSVRGNVNFNWRLIMAPPEAMDYVVVHELCHLREMNHSARFWGLVERALPTYEKWKDWLTSQGSKLYF
ncbi:MAG: hypothetical protein A2201_00690 [Alicyclobacillus sp. RIFOXYA1_FULL_53_8]|nr:MAG: hypothetical protein A2201_00690 [Alicyclobacillus sp. RIFOXYA1_FULL_53_8]